MKYVSFDLETTMDGTNRSPSPFWPENKILCGVCTIVTDDDEEVDRYGESRSNDTYLLYERLTGKIEDEEVPDFLIGHNMKFDISYVYVAMRKLMVADAFPKYKPTDLPDLWDIRKTGQWWDTSIAHYILTGQKDIYPSLETALDRYPSIVVKKSKYLSDFLTANPDKTTKDCDRTKLLEYCVVDTDATYLLAKAQMKEAIVEGKFALIVSMCDALRAVTEMECTGLTVNYTNLLEASNHYNDERTEKLKNALAFLVSATDRIDWTGIPAIFHLDAVSAILGSNAIMSDLLFGSSSDRKTKIVIGKNMNGTNKWGNIAIKSGKGLIDTLAIDTIVKDMNKLKSGVYSVDADSIRKMVSVVVGLGDDSLAAFGETILALREAEKILNTYLIPLPEVIRPYGLVHPNLHQTSTATGRLSSSKPNFQNLPNDKFVKRVYTPHEYNSKAIGSDLVFLEFDYKQLEVIAIAYLTGCPALIADISAGVDIHNRIGQKVLGHTPSKEERRDIKTVVFAMLYGSGAVNIARTTGLGLSLVSKIVVQFKATYKGVFNHHRANQAHLEGVCKFQGLVDGNTVSHHTRTGRHYALPVYRNVTPMGVSYGPSWTQICNYPCQGFATGDIVPTMLGVLLDSRKDCPYDFKLRNTVHDSILVSCEREHSKEVAKFIKGVLENPYEPLARLYDIKDFTLPLLVEASIGETWGTMVPLEV